MSKKGMLAVFLALLLGAGGILFAAGQITNYMISNAGSIVSSSNLEYDTTHIDWGANLDPGDNIERVVKFWNLGTTSMPVTIAVDNFNTAAAQTYLSLTWNYTGQLIGKTPVPIAFTLHVSPSIQDVSTFSFNIIINM